MYVCPLITVIMPIPALHQRKVILFDPMWPFTNACHCPYSLYDGFGGILMNIYGPLQLNAQHEMKYCAAWGLFALRHKSKSTYCQLHTKCYRLEPAGYFNLLVCSNLKIPVNVGMCTRFCSRGNLLCFSLYFFQCQILCFRQLFH